MLGGTARRDRRSNLAMALQSQLVQPQTTAVLADGTQAQPSPQSQVGLQEQVFLPDGQVQVW